MMFMNTHEQTLHSRFFPFIEYSISRPCVLNERDLYGVLIYRCDSFTTVLNERDLDGVLIYRCELGKKCCRKVVLF